MLNFRKMTEQDIDQVAGLEKSIFSDAWTYQGILETFQQSYTFIVVAEEDGKIAGYCIMYTVLDEGELARIAVDNDWRRQGAGRGILDFVVACCREKGVERLLLDVRESNAGARKFYENYGFTEDGIRKNFYENPKEHAVLMSKTIL